MEKELTQEKINEIDRIFNITPSQNKKALKIVENFKEAKKEMEEQGFEFVDRWREETFIKDKNTGKIYKIDDDILSGNQKDIKDKIAHLKTFSTAEWAKETIKFCKELLNNKEFKGFKKLDKMLTSYQIYYKNFFKNETELYLLEATSKNTNVRKEIVKYYEYERASDPRTQPYASFFKKQGYDGIQFNENEIVVFDSKQIKSIDNTGSWTDSAGKITKEKPSDESARHSYFNPQSPNILHSNEIWGGGLAGGTLNGLETDEDGNIIGFDPAKFVAGFIAGAAGTKTVKLMLNSKAGQNHALKVATNISEDFKALRENNLPLFAKIMQKIEPQTLLKSSKEAKNLSNKVFNTELKDAITKAINKGNIENLSVLKNQVHFSNVSEFKAYFDEVKGNQGVIKTPYKDIKVDIRYAFNHFRINTYNTNRDNIKPAFFSTFKKPLFVVEFTPQGKTKPSTYFYKPFYDENKNLLNLVGISINERGQLKFFTFYLDERGNRLKEFLKRTDLTIRYVEPSE